MISLAKNLLAKAPPTPLALELPRILALTQRPLPDAAELENYIERYTKMFSKGQVQCACLTKYKRRCPDRLLPLQAWTLHEAKQCNGVAAAIPVGEGKTLLNLLMPMMFQGLKNERGSNWVLAVPAKLKPQLLQVNWGFYEQHWHLPNLAGHGKWFVPGRPVLHVYSYEELSHPKNTGTLAELHPVGYIGDEIHSTLNPDSSRGIRFHRYFEKENAEAMLFGWSGTLIEGTIKRAATLAARALKEGSPYPRFEVLINELALEVDPVFDTEDWRKQKEVPRQRTNWDKLRVSETSIAEAVARRARETPGFITSNAKSTCKASLNITARMPKIPKRLEELAANVNRLAERPDGEILFTALEKYRCMSQIVSGFYYRWVWPNKEPLELRERWLAARKEYNAEVRAKMSSGREGLDSPALLSQAAQRWVRGYTYIENDVEVRVPPYTKGHPDVAIWKSEHWKAWKEVEDLCHPETETVWEDNYLVLDAAAWAKAHKKNPGVLWFEHRAFGKALAAATGLRLYQGGTAENEQIIHESGDECIIASIKAHGTGKELQMFSEALICNVPAKGWEQLLGRHHRQGQLADEVNFDVYRHCSVYINALEKAVMRSEWDEEQQGGEQKLTSKATLSW